MFPYLATGGLSATQNIYSNDWAFQRGNETTALADIDEFCSLGCGPNTAPRFFQRQFSSLYAWSNVGGSSYNAGQLILRHAMSHGVQFDFTYTLSNSIDLGSDTERTNELNGTGSTLQQRRLFLRDHQYLPSRIQPGSLRLRHAAPPQCRLGHPVAFWIRPAFPQYWWRIVDGFVGGWQFSGLARWSSGLPFSLTGPGWATNWQQESNL